MCAHNLTKKRSHVRGLLQKLQRRRLLLEAIEPRLLLTAEVSPSVPDSLLAGEYDQTFTGSSQGDRFRTGSGRQLVLGRGSGDHFQSFADAGEPDPAQTGGSGRVTDPVPERLARDVFVGAGGADTFEFLPLLNAQPEVLDQFRNHDSGQVNWADVAHQNDNVHEHWVEGIGLDVIADYSKTQGDRIKVTGHTASLAAIRYGGDSLGSYSLIVLRSDQGGAGAHDGDTLGEIKVYGDKVTAGDVEINAGVTYGMERLEEANRLAEHNGGGIREIISATHGDSHTGGGRVRDVVTLGQGGQSIDAQAGNDHFIILADGGEPDPAQTQGRNRVNPPVDAAQAADVVAGGQGKDVFIFRPLLNAKREILKKHTRADGTVNWRRVAGENNNVHDHWVESLGHDVIRDFDKDDGDEIHVEGHTAALAGIEYGQDSGGTYSLIRLISDQGNAGAHNRDSLGTIKVHGDRVTADDLTIKNHVYYGVDQLAAAKANDNSQERDALYGSPSEEFQDYVPDYTATHFFVGTKQGDQFRVGNGRQSIVAGADGDHILSFGDAGEPDPAQTGGTGRITDRVPVELTHDLFLGGRGADTFEFLPLLNATPEVLDQFRNHDSGQVNWAHVAHQNDYVHEHWVEGVGLDVIADYNKAEGDRIKVTGHTASVAAIEYGTDAQGSYSLIRLRSDQGGAGAHDGDSLGAIKVYGDKVTEEDVEINAGVTYGMERVREADRLAPHNGGGTREIISATQGDSFTGGGRVRDLITLGRGSQTIDAQAGNDKFIILADGGEPDPAQTGGRGRVNSPVAPAQSTDDVRGGLGKDVFVFRPLLNAKEEILKKHTRKDGTVNWRRVAGENNNVHDHWVESLGHDVIRDFDNDDGDEIQIQGHTVALAGIEYGQDAGGAYSLIRLVSDQGGAGAHDGDALGTIKVYGDRVEACDLTIDDHVYYGVSQLAEADANDNSAARVAGLYGLPGANPASGSSLAASKSNSSGASSRMTSTPAASVSSSAGESASRRSQAFRAWALKVDELFGAVAGRPCHVIQG